MLENLSWSLVVPFLLVALPLAVAWLTLQRTLGQLSRLSQRLLALPSWLLSGMQYHLLDLLDQQAPQTYAQQTYLLPWV